MVQKNTLIVVASLIFVLLISYLIGHFVINKQPEFSSLYDCKITYWEACGLNITEDMCYQLENNTNLEWIDCPVVSEKVKNCYEDKLNYCLGKEYE